MKYTDFKFSIDPKSGVTLTEQIRQQLIWLITSGQLIPGQPLPSIRRLADQLAVNLHTVRNAYQKLEEDGVIKINPGKRAVILPYDAQQLSVIANQQRSHTIGVILPSMSNPFYHEFIQGVDEIARQDQTLIFICNSNDDQEEAFRYLAQLSAKHVDGILLASHSLNTRIPRQVREEENANLPMVTVDWPGAEGYSVVFDYENAGYQATQHLLEHGHQRIGLITYDKEVANVQPVNRGYEKALQKADIELDLALIARVNGFGVQAGIAGARRLLSLDEPPTAIFSIADTLALGVMQAIKAADLHIPENVALTSFNNIAYAELADPPLTTVAAPVREMGVKAMEMLRDLIAGRNPAKRKVLLKTSLIIRQSCGCQVSD